MIKIIAKLLALTLIATASFADVLRLNPDAPDRYVVVKGDTLWDISGRFLSDPWRWPDIWFANEQIENPHLIYPGDVLALVWRDGQPGITTIRRGNEASLNVQQGNLERLSPSIRVEPIESAIPAIRIEHIRGFLNGNLVLDAASLRDAAYIVAADESRSVLGQGDRIYARGNWTDAAGTYEVFRDMGPIVDPQTKEVLGYEAHGLGEARYHRHQDQMASLDITVSRENIAVNDRVISLPATPLNTVFNPSPAPKVDGEILKVNSGVRFIGQFDVILLNRGEREGLAPGNVVEIWRVGERVRDPQTNQWVQLPSEEAGLAMVFRTFDKLSYALMLEALTPMRVGDRFTEPSRSLR